MSNPNQLLTAAVTAFEQWRKTRAYAKVKTPESLRQQAVALLSHHCASTIIKTLKISDSNFKRWLQQSQTIGGEAEFITLPCVEEPVDTAPAGLNLELTFNSGCQLRLQGDISPAQLTALVQGVNIVAEVVA
jgi:hypothetical protein